MGRKKRQPPSSPPGQATVQTTGGGRPPVEFAGIPEELKVKRYTLSEAALAQRRSAAHTSKKKNYHPNSARNSYKHGRYARDFLSKIKPCFSTCKKFPCELVSDGSTKPGGDCLDKQEIFGFYRAVHEALANKKYEDWNDLAAAQIAHTVKVLDMLLEDIMRDGTIVKREKYDANGNLIIDYVPHPSLMTLPKLIADLGMTPAEFMITPRALARKEKDDDEEKGLAALMSRLGEAMSKKAAASRGDRGDDE